MHSEWPTPPKHIFLTGPPEIGKSTIIDSVRARLAAGVEMPGFITKELRDAAGERIGTELGENIGGYIGDHL